MRASEEMHVSDAARLSGRVAFMRFAAVASALSLSVSGCGGGKKPAGDHGRKSAGSNAPLSEKPIASEPMEHEDGPAHVDLLALDRTARNTVTLRLRIANDGRQKIRLLTALGDMTENSSVSERANGITLVDGVGQHVYYPLTTSGGACLCSDVTNIEVPVGGTQELYAVYPAPPAGTDRVTVSVPLTVKFADTRIGAGQAPPVPGQADPAKVPMGRPEVRALVHSSESAAQDIDDDGDNRTLKLSADVLFAYNKAVLTSKAQAVLRDVARQIDASKGTTVKIDGYTDNTGTDAVNQPLSEHRAQAVQGALTKLVTRQGVTYQSAGHGSQNPVAKNDDESGRRRNRRVTVTFAEPPEARSSTPTSGPPFRWTAGGRLPVLASARPNFHTSAANATIEGADDLRFDVNSVHRDPSGLVTLVWTVTNVGKQDQMVAGALGKWLSLEYPGATTTSGASLVDEAGQMRYWPSRDGQGVCVCSSTSEAAYAVQTVRPDASATYSDVYQPPATVSRADVQISWYGLKVDVGSVPVR